MLHVGGRGQAMAAVEHIGGLADEGVVVEVVVVNQQDHGVGGGDLLGSGVDPTYPRRLVDR